MVSSSLFLTGLSENVLLANITGIGSLPATTEYACGLLNIPASLTVTVDPESGGVYTALPPVMFLNTNLAYHKKVSPVMVVSLIA